MPRFLNPVDKHTFVVRLPEINLKPGRGRSLPKAFFDAGKRAGTVNLRLPLANEIQVRAIEDKDRLH